MTKLAHDLKKAKLRSLRPSRRRDFRHLSEAPPNLQISVRSVGCCGQGEPWREQWAGVKTWADPAPWKEAALVLFASVKA